MGGGEALNDSVNDVLAEIRKFARNERFMREWRAWWGGVHRAGLNASPDTHTHSFHTFTLVCVDVDVDKNSSSEPA